jgi:hypothetical protein
METETPLASTFDTLREASPTGYARPSGEFDPRDLSQDHVSNLRLIRDRLVEKRRYFAQDVLAYPPTLVGRASDIAAIQSVIDRVEAAILHETRMEEGR